MQQKSIVLFHKFGILYAGIFALAFLVLCSALVTNIGSKTVLNSKIHPSMGSVDSGMSDGPNIVTNGMSALSGDMQQALLSVGITIYDACKSVTVTSVKTGTSTTHFSATVVDGIWHGTTFTLRGIASITSGTLRAFGSGAGFIVHLPGTLFRPITHLHMVSDLIRPTDNTKSVPIISAETSAAALASLSAAQQQQIAKLQAAQLTANQQLNGTIVASSTDDGGYPAKWNDISQDSTLDSWGMYNRECVSYAAWKVYQTYGDMPYWGGVGNANQWVSDAIRAGIPTSATPKIHSVAISMHGYYGHAMWVEAVNGNMIYVSQYNYDLNGHFSEMWVNGSSFTYLYFK
jgi:surface antigen